LTDLEMPQLNGLDLARRLRAEAATQSLPIVMITSRSTDKHRRAAEEAGIDLYLTKPYTDEQLLGHLRRLLLS
jgi:chemosensory pili system protein ChpA (sensor histidine kinase/response regulator)